MRGEMLVHGRVPGARHSREARELDHAGVHGRRGSHVVCYARWKTRVERERKGRLRAGVGGREESERRWGVSEALGGAWRT